MICKQLTLIAESPQKMLWFCMTSCVDSPIKFKIKKKTQTGDGDGKQSIWIIKKHMKILQW